MLRSVLEASIPRQQEARTHDVGARGFNGCCPDVQAEEGKPVRGKGKGEAKGNMEFRIREACRRVACLLCLLCCLTGPNVHSF